MTRFICAVTAAIAFSACAGVDDGGSGGGGGCGTPPPAGSDLVVGDLTSATFDSQTEELRVQIAFSGPGPMPAFAQDGVPVLGYLRFSRQEDALLPAFTAYARESTDGSVQAVVVADGGQFARFSGGTVAVQNNYVAPTGGSARYLGSYVGLLNLGGPTGTAPDDAGEATPRVSTTVTGHALINADFNRLRIEGRINDRQALIDGEMVDLREIILIEDAIATDGRFNGTVEQRNAGGNTSGVGSYSGTLGGQQANAIAGMIRLDGNFIDVPGINNEFEYGIFVLDKCQAGTPACLEVTNP
ncbi:MAG: hypothetical protein IKD58_08395 [Loktanella sp.]|nr:hypothetical protein [Loktanella sp.]